MKKEFWEIYGWIRSLIEGKKPVYKDPKMQKVFDDYMDALEEYNAELKSGKATVENFTERWKEIVEPKRKAFEDYQTLKAMGVKMTPVEGKG